MQLDVVWLFDSFAGNDSDDIDLTEDKNVRPMPALAGPFGPPCRDTWSVMKHRHLSVTTRSGTTQVSRGSDDGGTEDMSAS